VLHLATAGYDGAREFLQAPLNLVLILLTLLIAFYHMHLGMRVIIEDYIEHKASRLAWISLSAAASLLGAGIALISLLKVALGAPA
jgi:succinate dehydrogenase / fumarate reductase membrane anchor subunit